MPQTPWSTADEQKSTPLVPRASTRARLGIRPAVLAILCTVFGAVRPAGAQYLPSKPLTFAGDRVVIGGDVQAGVAPSDEGAWFNRTDYEHDALRMVRWSVSGEWRIASRLAALAELRGENADAPRVLAAYVRARPFSRVPLDVQAGRIPPAFGAFGRRVYSTDNPVIGYPLAYQYLLSIRPDAIPADADELLRMRARGWLSSFSVGSPEPHPGVSTVDSFEWDTGVQVRVGTDRLQGSVALTNGVLSDPQFVDNNSGKQWSARVQVQPAFGLILGVSGASGAWLDREVESLIAPGQDRARQEAVGFDAEYSRGYWIVRAEVIRSAWDIPGVSSPDGAMHLVGTSGLVEGRYRLTPRFYVAARADRLTFSRIYSPTLETDVPWEAPLWRIEGGGGYYLQRNLVGRVTVQSNHRDGGRVREHTVVATQVVFWF